MRLPNFYIKKNQKCQYQISQQIRIQHVCYTCNKIIKGPQLNTRSIQASTEPVEEVTVNSSLGDDYVMI